MTALRSLAAFLLDAATAVLIIAIEHVGKAQDEAAAEVEASPIYDQLYAERIERQADERSNLYDGADFEDWECEVRTS